MTPAAVAPTTAAAASSPRVAAVCAVASAAFGAVGVAFLAGMFGAFALGGRSLGMTLGLVNDCLVLASFPLIAPAMLTLRARLRPQAPRVIDLATLVGLAAVAAIVVLQAMLVRGDLTFEEQIGWLSIAFVAFDAWLLVVGWVGRRSGLLPGGITMALVGATYVGYPAWALWAARHLSGGAIFAPADPSADPSAG